MVSDTPKSVLIGIRGWENHSGSEKQHTPLRSAGGASGIRVRVRPPESGGGEPGDGTMTSVLRELSSKRLGGRSLALQAN